MKRGSHLRKFRNWLWLAALPLLAWLIRDVPFEGIWNKFGNLSPGRLLVLAAMNSGILALMTARWWLTLKAQGKSLPFFSLLLVRLAGFGISYFTPGPQFGGEPVQIQLLRTRHQVTGAGALASVTLDRLFELLGNLSFLILGAVVVLENQFFEVRSSSAIIVFLLFSLSLPLTYLIILGLGWHPLSWLFSRFSQGASGWVVGKAMRLIAAGEVQASKVCREKPWVVWSALPLSALIWVLMITEYRLMLNYLDIPLSLPQAVSALMAARLAFIAPVPGGLGTLEASQALAMEMLGLDPAAGIAASLLIRGRDVFLALTGFLLIPVLSRGGSDKTLATQVEQQLNP